MAMSKYDWWKIERCFGRAGFVFLNARDPSRALGENPEKRIVLV
jgi:hypothetical protein